MQDTRIKNMLRDENKLFLINYEIDKQKRHAFTVCNANDETKPCIVKVNNIDKRTGMENTIICSCKDYAFRCYKNNIICKHCVFVVNRCLKLDVTNIVNGRQITDLQKFESKLNTIQIVKRLNINTNEEFLKNEKEMDKDDICPICMDDLVTEDCVSCPTCKNYVHKTCIGVWLRTNKNCIYCRSTIWNKYK